MTPVLVDCADLSVPDDDDDQGGGGGGPGSDTSAIHNGDSAGGDLQGSYPNPTINPALIFPGSPVSQADIDASVADEATLRSSADTTLTNSVSSEASTRAAAVSSEATTRASADTGLGNSITSTNSTVSTLSSSLTAETTARSSGDAAVVASSVQRGVEQISVLDHGLNNTGNQTAGTGTDNLAAWNALIVQINAGTYSDIWFPEGVYIFSGDPNPITASNVHIHGAGGATVLRAKAALPRMGSFFTIGKADGSGTQPSYVVIENFMLKCNAGGTGFEPTNLQNAVLINDGGHIVVRNLIVDEVAGLVTVGTHTGLLQGTVSSVNSSTDTITMSAAHGLSAGDQIIFSGTVPTGITAGQVYIVLAAGLTTTALRVSLVAGGSTVDITTTTTGATFDSSFAARVQRYQVQNIIGTINEVTAGANRIWVLNGTSGFYSSIQTVCHSMQGGSVIKNQPLSNNDQHWFTDVHMQGGADYWINIDVNSGDVYNWVFKQCVMDGSMINAVWIHCERGANSATDVHFIDCHCSTWGGTPILLNHGGTGDWRSIQFIGGRYKWLNGDGTNWGACRIGGSGAANILSSNFQGVNFLADRLTITGLSAANDTLSVTRAADGRGHGLNVGDRVVINTTTNGITADTLYYVHAVSASGSPSGGVTLSNDTFQLTTTAGGGGSALDITGSFTSSFILQGYVNAMMTFAAAPCVRVNSCHFGAMYGTPNYAKYAITMTAAATLYNVQGNVARGLDAPLTGGTASFSDGSLVHDATLPQTTVYFNNASDVGTT